MSKHSSPKLANLRELLATLGLAFQIQTETADILEEYETRIYSLEEDRKRLVADYKALDSRCNSLEKRYSELLYRFSEVVQASK